tara:strand:+ start:347 stop:556 length:210 start_codon:yes stop_codon:yes gene_type:complete
MATKVCTQKECPVLGNCDNDVVTKAFAKVGVCRSMLVTLALLPFAWSGVMWAAGAVKSVWDAATTAVGS